MLKTENENLKRELRTLRDSTGRTARTMQEALDLKTRLAANLQAENKRLMADREVEMQRIAQLREEEHSRLQSELKTRYRSHLEAQNVMDRSIELHKSADELSHRVQLHLAQAHQPSPPVPKKAWP